MSFKYIWWIFKCFVHIHNYFIFQIKKYIQRILQNEIIDKECEILLFLKDNLICLFFGTKFNKLNFDQ